MHSNCEKETFRSSEVNIEDIKKYILELDKNKTSQHSDIPIKIIKENLDIFANFLCINISFKLSLFPFYLKKADVTPLHKKKEGIENTDQVSNLPIFTKYLKGPCLHKCQVFLIAFCQNNNVACGKAIVRNSVFWLCL